MVLTDVAIRNLRGKPGEGDKAKPYKVSDGGGLYILVQPDGSRYWRLAYRFGGKQKTLALGVYPVVTLLEARKKRDAAKEQIKQGVDPSHSRKLEKLAAQVAAANSFESVAREWHENQLERWTPEHAGRTMRRLERDAFSIIGARPIAKAGSKWTMHFSAASDRAANAGAEVLENSRLLRQWKPRRTAGPCA